MLSLVLSLDLVAPNEIENREPFEEVGSNSIFERYLSTRKCPGIWKDFLKSVAGGFRVVRARGGGDGALPPRAAGHGNASHLDPKEFNHFPDHLMSVLGNVFGNDRLLMT